MNAGHMDLALRIALLVGSLAYFGLILALLKRKKLTVRYSIIWLLSGGVLLLFALFPYIVLVLRDLLKMEMPVNVVFTLSIAFMLLLLLSLSVAVSGFAEKLRRLTQQQALLEKRVRELEEQSGDANRNETTSK